MGECTGGLTWESHLLDDGEGQREDGVIVRGVLVDRICIVVPPLQLHSLDIVEPFDTLDLAVHGGHIVY